MKLAFLEDGGLLGDLDPATKLERLVSACESGGLGNWLADWADATDTGVRDGDVESNGGK